MHLDGAPRRPGTGLALDPVAALDGLLPGLADALLDLLDTIDDRAEGVVDDGQVLLGLVCDRLLPRWDALPGDARVLAVLDAIRVVLGQR